MDDVPANLPGLLYAHKIQGKAASVGFDWDAVTGAMAKVGEELSELEEAIAASPQGPPQPGGPACATNSVIFSSQ